MADHKEGSENGKKSSHNSDHGEGKDRKKRTGNKKQKRKRNQKKVSTKISLLIKEGKTPEKAAAQAFSMLRAGKL